MASGKKYRVVGSHAEEVVPGQFFEPGDEVSLTSTEQDDDNVKRLLDESRLVEIESARKEGNK